MRKINAFFIATVIAVVQQSAIAGGDPPGVDPLIPGRAIVRLPAGAAIGPFLKTLNADFPTIHAQLIESLGSRNLHLIVHDPLGHPAIDALEDALNETYPAQGLLVYGELLYEGKAPEGSSGSIWVDGPATAALYSDQYITPLIGLDAAHKTASGQSTVVAVLDTGLDSTHPVFAGRIAPGGFNFLNDSTNTADVGDGQDNDADGATDELVGHGTYVAGLIALAAPEARLLPITVLNSDGKGDNWILAKGMFHAIDRGVEVINLSLTSTYDSVAIQDSIGEARTRGIVVVAAAGNWDRDDPREYPAMDDDVPVIGVAATDDNDVKGDFSNFSDRLYLSAPGVSFINAGVPVPGRSVVSAMPGSAFAISQGTSMATPLVSAACALVRSQHPEWPAAPSTVTAIRQVLRTTAVDIDQQNPGHAGELGHGRLNVAAAVAAGPAAPRVGDLNNDGAVGIDDLLAVISAWGAVHSSADFDGDGVVDIDDLLQLIGNWG